MLTIPMLQNPVDPDDVNADGILSPLDVLTCINKINNGQTEIHGYFDVDGDHVLSAMDVLLIINRLNMRNEFWPDLMPPARTFDGTGNNVDHSDWGSAGSDLLRFGPSAYSDGQAALAGRDRPNPREISNAVVAQSQSLMNSSRLTDMFWQWGQFLDHDLDLTDTATPAEFAPIPVPAGDAHFDPRGTGEMTIGFKRSQYNPNSGTSPDAPRQQINQLTAFIDGSNVYGSDANRAAALRTFAGGRLKTSDDNLLPWNVDQLPNAGSTSADFFLAGDVRVNEQVGLIAMHTLWVREHNRLADQIVEHHPDWSDETIYQRARSIVIAEMQVITYHEFLPALLGYAAMPAYAGYDPTVNPGISNMFSTASFRFGHTMLPTQLLRLDEEYRVIPEGNLPLRNAFFNPGEILATGIDPVLRGLATQQAQAMDTMIVDDVRNFLFGPPGAGGFDLAALNIQRGRDHGLPDYNQARVEFGLPPVTSFSDITSNPELQARLAQVYDSVDVIDPWVGGLAEDAVPGGSVGPLLRAVLIDQFTRLRDGDRFWYERVFAGGMKLMIERTRLADVIRRNTEIQQLQTWVFFLSTEMTGGEGEAPPVALAADDAFADHARLSSRLSPGPVAESTRAANGSVLASGRRLALPRLQPQSASFFPRPPFRVFSTTTTAHNDNLHVRDADDLPELSGQVSWTQHVDQLWAEFGIAPPWGQVAGNLAVHGHW